MAALALLSACGRVGFHQEQVGDDEAGPRQVSLLENLNQLAQLQAAGSDCLRQLTVDPFGLHIECETGSALCSAAGATGTCAAPQTQFPRVQWGTAGDQCGVFRHDDRDGDGNADLIYERHLTAAGWCDYQMYPPDSALVQRWGALQQIDVDLLTVAHPSGEEASCGFAFAFGELGDGDIATADGPPSAPNMNINLRMNGRDWSQSLGRFNEGINHFSDLPHPNDQIRVRYSAVNVDGRPDYPDMTLMQTWFNQNDQAWRHVNWQESVGTIQPAWDHPQAVGEPGEWVLLHMRLRFDHQARTMTLELTPLDRGSNYGFVERVATPTANVSAWSEKSFVWRYAEHVDVASGDENWAFDLTRAGAAGSDLTWEELDALPTSIGFTMMGSPAECVWFDAVATVSE